MLKILSLSIQRGVFGAIFYAASLLLWHLFAPSADGLVYLTSGVFFVPPSQVTPQRED